MSRLILALMALATVVIAMPLEPITPPGASSAPFDSNTQTGPELSALKHALIEANSYSERQAILLPNPPDASNITFTFINNTVTNGTGGTIALGTRNNFPAFIGTNVAMAVGFVNPCGLNVPHSHPRANEFLTVIQGTLVGALILESNPGGNGNVVGMPPSVPGSLPQVNVTLSPYTGMLFPQGETHFQFNPTCEPALFAAAFDSSDPGRTQIARNFFSVMPDEVLGAATGVGDMLVDPQMRAELRGRIPTAFAVIIDECAKRCGI